MIRLLLIPLTILLALLFGGCTHVTPVAIDNATIIEPDGKEPIELTAVSEVEPSDDYELFIKVGAHRYNLESDQTTAELVSKSVENALAAQGYYVAEGTAAPNKVDVTVERFALHNAPAMWSLSFQTNITVRVDYELNGEESSLVARGYGKNVCQVANRANFELSIQRALENLEENLIVELAKAGF